MLMRAARLRHSGGRMLSRQIKDLLDARAPFGLCDPCIAAKLGVKPGTRLQTITEAFGITNDFTRHPGHCPECGKQDWVIKAGGTQ